jgi:hypothetical protein
MIQVLTLCLVFPGAVYIIGSWYRQYETAKRVSVFYMAALLASGFGPIVRRELVLTRTWLTRPSLHTHCH